ncbi:MAG: ABC transporter ATP-binding protein [Anaerolineae bacterium]|nr:ABC transporter ATP-binding protein [Anaerolineae bacterium]
MLLEVVRVHQSFGGVRALDDVSCKVYEGQTLALIGPNGAGKTTLLNVVAGTLRPSGGEVLMRGRSILRLSAPERVRLGLVRTFQQALLFDGMTALENVMVGAHLRGRRGLADAALRTPASRREEEDLYLEGMRYLNLVGLGSKAEDPAASLPFGQQRLLAVARALAAEPSLLLLDEPGAGLNRLEKDSLADLIRRIREMGITVVLVEHDMGLVMRLADWVVVLDQGRRLAQGTPVEVRRNPAVIEAYLGTGDGAHA